MGCLRGRDALAATGVRWPLGRPAGLMTALRARGGLPAGLSA